MLDFLLSEAGISVLGAGGGFIARQYAESARATREFRLKAIKASTESMDAAATRPGGVAMRRAIYGLVAFMFVAVIFAGFKGIPVVVETEVQKGLLFWKKTVTEFTEIHGVLFPPEARKGFLLILSFYLGQGVK